MVALLKDFKIVNPIVLEVGGSQIDSVTGITAGANNWFDGATQSVSTGGTSIVINITPDLLVNSVSLLNIDADAVNVTVTDPIEGVVYNKDVSMADLSGIDFYYEWFFSPIINISNVVLTDLPNYLGTTITVTLTSTTTTQLGELVLGSAIILGDCIYGLGLGIEDYSTKEVDGATGVVTIEEKRFAKTVDYVANVQTSRLNYIQKKLAEFRAKPALFIGYEEQEETVVYGFYKSFSLVLSSPILSTCNIEVEELS